MRILITGAAGFLGRNVLAQLGASHEWVATWRGGGDFVEWCRTRGSIESRACDLADGPAVGRCFAPNEHFDVVLHLAANGDPAASISNPAGDLCSGPLTLLTLFGRIRARRLIYFSSGAVYDGCRGAVNPASPTSPTLPYAVGKLACEQYVRALPARLGRIDEFVNVRFFGAFGPWEPPRKIYTRLVQCFGIERRAEFAIRGDGRNLIDAMYVSDAVEAVQALIEGPALNRTVDLASGQPLSIRSLVERAAHCFGIAPRVICSGDVPEYIEFHSDCSDQRRWWPDGPRVPLEDGLRRLCRHLTDGKTNDGAGISPVKHRRDAGATQTAGV